MGIIDRLSTAWTVFTGSQEIQKSNSGEIDLEKSQASRESKAYVEDPLGFIQAMGYKSRPYSLSFEILRRMATKNSVIASIINTRVNQVSTFSTPARFNKDSVGFEIRLRDPNKTPEKEDLEIITAIEQFLENTGYHKDTSRDDFDTFIRKIVRDRLTYDQVCYEIVPDKKGRPSEFYAVDASTIRIANEDIKESYSEFSDDIKGVKNKEEVRYVQVLSGQIRSLFTSDEMGFSISNPRTDINVSGYGFSELEMLIQQITSHLWAEEYNGRFFSQGGTTKGILNLKGAAHAPISPQQIESFKRQWVSQLSGITGAWKTPIVSVDGLEYINVSQSNREMEFEKWMNYLINVSCAVYQIDPAEINFPNRGGAGGSGGGLSEGGVGERIQYSRDKGLRPLLRFIESSINKHIVSKFDQRFVFSFVGFDSKSEKEMLDLKQTKVKTFLTVNEIRQEEGLEPLEFGDLILDNTYIQYLSQKAQEKMMGGGGDEDDGNEDDGNEDDGNEDEDDGNEDEDDGQIDYENDFENVKKSGNAKFLVIEFD